MCVEVKNFHLVGIFAKIYQCKQGGQIFVPKTFPTFRFFHNLAIYIYDPLSDCSRNRENSLKYTYFINADDNFLAFFTHGPLGLFNGEVTKSC